jgi:hypothetical protein
MAKRYAERLVPSLVESVKVARNFGISIVDGRPPEIDPVISTPSVLLEIGVKDCGFQAAIDELLLSPKAFAELGHSGFDLGDIPSKLLRIELEAGSAEQALNLWACFYPSDFLLACLRAGRAGNV